MWTTCRASSRTSWPPFGAPRRTGGSTTAWTWLSVSTPAPADLRRRRSEVRPTLAASDAVPGFVERAPGRSRPVLPDLTGREAGPDTPNDGREQARPSRTNRDRQRPRIAGAAGQARRAAGPTECRGAATSPGCGGAYPRCAAEARAGRPGTPCPPGGVGRQLGRRPGDPGSSAPDRAGRAQRTDPGAGRQAHQRSRRLLALAGGRPPPARAGGQARKDLRPAGRRPGDIRAEGAGRHSAGGGRATGRGRATSHPGEVDDRSRARQGRGGQGACR